MDGIAITLYDKFDELSVLVDIIQENWENDYNITVCSNHPEGQEKLRKAHINVDNYVQGGRIAFSPEMDNPRHWLNLRTRIFDSIQQSCRTAIQNADGYVMHLHADAWPLSEAKFQELKSKLEDRNRFLAVRGLGLEWRTPNCPLGQVMDQFFLIDAKFARENDVFDVNPLSMIPHTSIHNMLFTLFVARVGFENVWWYSRMQDDRQWDGSPIDLPYTGVRPGIVNPEWGLLHIATDEFPDDLGKSVQVHHLLEKDDWIGENINNYINKYENQDVFDELTEYERRLNRRMKRLGYQPGQFGREFAKMETAYEKGRDQLLKTLIKNYSNILLKQPLFYALSKLPINRFNHLSSPRGYRFHRDAEWPTTGVVDRYQNHVKKEDYPTEMSHWYESFYPD